MGSSLIGSTDPGLSRTGRAPLSLNERIDLCRGLFAILVVIDHAMQVTWGIHRGAEGALNPLTRDLLNCFLGSSTVYVMGFFVLSGFCIELSGTKLFKAGRFDAKRYTLARASRILPLYYAALLFVVVVEWLIASARPFTWPNGVEGWVLRSQLVLLQNVTQTYGSFVASWSITNEVFYYFVYGALAWGFASQGRTPAKVGLSLCFAIAFVTQILYVTSARHPVVYSLGMLLGLGMIWFAGVLIAQRGDVWLRWRIVRVLAALWPVFFAVSLLWKYLHLPPQGIYLIPGFAFSLMMLRFMDLEQRRLHATSAGHVVRSISTARARGIEAMGLLSYPMYLFHGPLLMLIGSILIRLNLAVDWRITWGVLVAIGLVSGLAMGWWIERPFMAWRSAWLKSWKPSAVKSRSTNLAPLTSPGISSC